MSEDERPLSDLRIDHAEEQAGEAGLSREQTASMMAYMLGATLTHFDETPIVPMTDSRWRRIVRSAIEHATA